MAHNKKHTEETKNRIRLSEMGNKNHFYGRHHTLETRLRISKTKKLQLKKELYKTTQTNLIRKSLEYRLWRQAVFERDNWTCIWCGARNGDGKKHVLHADHIKRFSEFPELRFAIDNGRTLCLECHRKTDTYGNKSKNPPKWQV